LIGGGTCSPISMPSRLTTGGAGDRTPSNE
jgi:hypothetical protein